MSFRRFQAMSVDDRKELLAHKFYEKKLVPRVRIISDQVGGAPNALQLKALTTSLMGYYFAPRSDEFEYFRQAAATGPYNKGEEFIMFSKSAYPYVFGVTEKEGPREIIGLAAIIKDYFTRYPLDDLDDYLLYGDFTGKTLEVVADEAPSIEGRITNEDDVQKRIRRHFF